MPPRATLPILLGPLVLAALCAPIGTAAESPKETVVRDIGSRRELFVDHWLIDRLKTARLRLHQPEPRELAIRYNKPWEGILSGDPIIFKDGDVYRMYYRGLPKAGVDGTDREVTCYAESPDGIHWKKPILRLFEVDGSRENNVILAHMPPLSHNFAPFLDTNPKAKKSERLKAVAGCAGGLRALASADGVHWKLLRKKAVFTKGAFDSLNVAFWSPAEKCYVCYFRTWDGFRTISRTTSPDFIHWAEPKPMTYGDTPREHLYTNGTQPYFRAPHIYVAIAARFFPGRQILSDAEAKKRGVHASYFKDCSDTVLMSTRGGYLYDRTFMESFIRPGVGLTNWVSRTNYPGYGVVPTSPTEMSVYIRRDYAQPTAHVQRCVLRTDGFVSVNAGYRGGEMVTHPLKFAGKQLEINFATSAAGSLRIELQDTKGAPIPGHTLRDAVPLIGDEIARTVTWKKAGPDVRALAGKPIRLRVVLRDADLYSIKFQ